MNLKTNAPWVDCDTEIGQHVEHLEVDTIAYARNDMFFRAYIDQCQLLCDQLHRTQLVVRIDHNNTVIDFAHLLPEPGPALLSTRRT